MPGMIMSYLGSKRSMMSILDTVITPLIDEDTVLCDMFAGTGVVSSFFRDRVKRVVANDLELYSYVLNKAVLECSYTPSLASIISKLNDTKPLEGLVYRHFFAKKRMFFTRENAVMIDGIRVAMSHMFNRGEITYKEFVFLLASLFHSVSKVANNAGTYRAYLKQYCKRSKMLFVLFPIHTTMLTKSQTRMCDVIKNDALVVAREGKFGLVYIDMPFSNMHYGGAYSFYNFLALYDQRVVPTGMAGITPFYNKSVFGLVATALNSFRTLVRSIHAKHIVMSYNMDGVLKKNEILGVLKAKGKTTVYTYTRKKYKPNTFAKGIVVDDYVFVVQVGCDIGEVAIG